jgi:nucleoside-triphosphatase THEP1
MQLKNIFITGNSGIGKTTLLQKVAAGIPGHAR